MDNKKSAPDSDLVAQAQSGDLRALDRLLCDARPGLLGYAASLMHSRDAAQDVVQEALLKVALNIARLEQPAAFRSWAMTILRREAVEHFRRQRRHLGEHTSYEDGRPDLQPAVSADA